MTWSGGPTAVVFVSVATALLSFVIYGELPWVLGGIALPFIQVVILPGGAFTLRQALRASLLVGAAYALSRIPVTLIQYYWMGWGTSLFRNAGGSGPMINSFSVLAVCTAQVALAFARICIALLVGLLAFSLRSYVGSRRTHR